VQVVVQEPANGCVPAGAVARGQPPGVLTEQVVQAVTAAGGLGDEVVVIQVVEVTAGGVQGGVVQGSCGVCVDAGTRVQAEPPEQTLLIRSEILV